MAKFNDSPKAKTFKAKRPMLRKLKVTGLRLYPILTLINTGLIIYLILTS